MTQRELTDNEIQDLKNRYATTSLRNLAREFRTSISAVREALLGAGVSIRGRGRPHYAVGPNKAQLEVVQEEEVVSSSEPTGFFRV